MKYEADMTVIFDVVSKMVFVSFRGKTSLLGPFVGQRAGIDAAEAHCRAMGWAASEAGLGRGVEMRCRQTRAYSAS